MKCSLCEYEAIPYDSSAGILGDTFHQISWELVNRQEYQARCNDGRTISINVCPSCYTEYTGRPSLPISVELAILNAKRKQESE